MCSLLFDKKICRLARYNKQVDNDKGENYELIYHEVPQHLYRDYIITPKNFFVKYFLRFLCKLYVNYNLT